MIFSLDKQGSDLATPSAAMLAPIQGASLGDGRLLGLKPQGESWCPFGAREQISKHHGPKGQEIKARVLAWVTRNRRVLSCKSRRNKAST
jgi:hypothetical protein